jgi:hypothetical protein
MAPPLPAPFWYRVATECGPIERAIHSIHRLDVRKEHRVGADIQGTADAFNAELRYSREVA